jgi:hypothetical protein
MHVLEAPRLAPGTTAAPWRCSVGPIRPDRYSTAGSLTANWPRPVVLDGSAGLPATSPWSVLFAGSGCLGSSSVGAMGRVIMARRCYAGGVEIW